MKKVFIFLLLIFFNTLFIKKTIAFEFIKYSNNPLNLSYMNNYSEHLQGHIFKEENQFKGIFAIKKPENNYYSLGLFNSFDGKNWVMEKEIINNSDNLSNPRFFKTSLEINKVFVTKYDNDNKYRIYSIDCDNNFNCDQTLNLILDINNSDSTEQNGIFAAFPYIQNNRIYLFYGVWGSDGFKIRLAYSNDLQTWTKCTNNRNIFLGDGPFVYEKESILYLFTHQSDGSGIKVAKTSFPLSCDSQFEDLGYILTRSANYDSHHMIFPSIIDSLDELLLYYIGLGDDYVWRLNLAKETIFFPTLTPTITSAPEPTLTFTPTPTITPFKKIVLIPGFMASWNKEAILHNQEVAYSQWLLGSYVKEYNGLINTFKNLGLIENKNFYIFTYDWRKSLNDISHDLKNFLDEKEISNTDFDIVGHSLGGLVGRIYQENYNNSKLQKLITVASPHKGVTQVYGPVEAGEIERYNNLLWLTEKLIINLNRNNFESDKQTLNRILPVLKDIFPTYDFLVKNGINILSSSMKIKNEVLINNQNNDNRYSIVGEKGQTLKGFTVKDQTLTDKILDFYPDGRPISNFKDIGDYLVLSDSSKLQRAEILNFDHGEIIYKKESIKKLLDLLNLTYHDSDIVEGKETKIDQSIVIIIKSPADIEVKHNDKIYQNNEGIIFIDNTENGLYQIEVTGINRGSYELIVGQIGKNEEVWESIYGETYSGKVDIYNLQYNSDLLKSINYDDFVNYLIINNYIIEPFNLSKIFHQLIKRKDFIGLEKYEKHLLNQQKQSKKNNKKEMWLEIKLIDEKIVRIKKPINNLIMNQILKRINLIKKEILNNNYYYCQILFDSIEELLKYLKK